MVFELLMTVDLALGKIVGTFCWVWGGVVSSEPPSSMNPAAAGTVACSWIYAVVGMAWAYYQNCGYSTGINAFAAAVSGARATEWDADPSLASTHLRAVVLRRDHRTQLTNPTPLSGLSR